MKKQKLNTLQFTIYLTLSQLQLHLNSVKIRLIICERRTGKTGKEGLIAYCKAICRRQPGGSTANHDYQQNISLKVDEKAGPSEYDAQITTGPRCNARFTFLFTLLFYDTTETSSHSNTNICYSWTLI
jgi:hypothetical protein